MAGAPVNHNRIVINLITQLRTTLRNTECEPFMSDMRLWIQAHELYTYPDITILCGEPQFHGTREDTIINPLVIIDILSDSTKDDDRGTKFQFYRSLASFREYVSTVKFRMLLHDIYAGVTSLSKGRQIC